MGITPPHKPPKTSPKPSIAWYFPKFPSGAYSIIKVFFPREKRVPENEERIRIAVIKENGAGMTTSVGKRSMSPIRSTKAVFITVLVLCS